VRGQFLWITSFAPNVPPQHSFQVRRARIVFEGFMGKHNRYKVELAMSPRDLGLDVLLNPDGTPSEEITVTQVPVLDWYAYFTYLRDFEVRLGQKKVPFSRQRVVSSGAQQFVDRSIVNAEFNLDRDLGVEFRSDDLGGLGHFRYRAGVSTAEGRNTSDELDNSLDFRFLYHVRFAYLPFGLFKDYSEADLERSSRPRLSIAAAYAYIDHPKRQRGILGDPFPEGVDPKFSHHFVVDSLFKWSGFSLTTEFQGRQFDRNIVGRNGWGLHVQAGYLFSKTGFEVAARTAVVRPWNERNTDLSTSNELVGALSYYLAGHALKLQADVGQNWGSTRPAEGSTIFRLQIQVSN